MNPNRCTPYLQFDERIIISATNAVAKMFAPSGCKLLYSLKSLAIQPAFDVIAPRFHGFSTSSLFEARLARDFVANDQVLQYVSPLMREAESEEIADLCDRVTLNSFSQLRRFRQKLANKTDVGLRINPRLSYVEDERYDPCRRNSKLGVSIYRFADELKNTPEDFACVSGLHIHSNCDCDNLNLWVDTIRHVETVLDGHLGRFRWLNLGGGYVLDDGSRGELLLSEIRRIAAKYCLEVVIEPGAALVRKAGTFVSTVQDLVDGDDYPIAVLDLSVNHWPEVFEYQFEPDVKGHVDGAPYTYLLAGCSCLAGDIFGEYSFEEPLTVGSRIFFENAGAYSIVKAHMFNGINLPSIYVIRENGEVELVREFTYEDFLARCGRSPYATV